MLIKGVLQAFKGQLIHTFNKREGALSRAAGLRELQGRPNVLLLGDSLGDLTMADGVSEHQNVLTIGFLNDQVRLTYSDILGFFISTHLSFRTWVLTVCVLFLRWRRERIRISTPLTSCW